MITESFKDILSEIVYGIVDNNPKYIGIERLEKVRNYRLKNNFEKLEIWHITDHINIMIENLFHESNEKLKEIVLNCGNYYYIGMMINMQILMKINLIMKTVKFNVYVYLIKYINDLNITP